MTPRLAEIIAAMIEAKLDAEDRRAAGQRGRMAPAGRNDRGTCRGSVGSRRGGRV